MVRRYTRVLEWGRPGCSWFSVCAYVCLGTRRPTVLAMYVCVSCWIHYNSALAMCVWTAEYCNTLLDLGVHSSMHMVDTKTCVAALLVCSMSANAFCPRVLRISRSMFTRCAMGSLPMSVWSFKPSTICSSNAINLGQTVPITHARIIIIYMCTYICIRCAH